MSHLTVLEKCKITSIDALVEALIEMGIRKESIEIHRKKPDFIRLCSGGISRQAMKLSGTKDDPRFTKGDVAHVIIRSNDITKNNLGGRFGIRRWFDMGFYVDSTGTTPLLDAEPHRHKVFMNELTKAALRRQAMRRARSEGRRIQHSEDLENGDKVLYIKL